MYRAGGRIAQNVAGSLRIEARPDNFSDFAWLPAL